MLELGIPRGWGAAFGLGNVTQGPLLTALELGAACQECYARAFLTEPQAHRQITLVWLFSPARDAVKLILQGGWLHLSESFHDSFFKTVLAKGEVPFVFVYVIRGLISICRCAIKT